MSGIVKGLFGSNDQEKLIKKQQRDLAATEAGQKALREGGRGLLAYTDDDPGTLGGRMQRELTPIFQDFFAIEAGPLVPEGDDKKALTEAFQGVGKITNGVLASGSFHMKSHEMFLDLFAGAQERPDRRSV